MRINNDGKVGAMADADMAVSLAPTLISAFGTRGEIHHKSGGDEGTHADAGTATGLEATATSRQ
jgi:hypothetical protein